MSFYRNRVSRKWIVLALAVPGAFYFLNCQFLRPEKLSKRDDDVQVFPLGPKDFQQMEIDYWKTIRVETMTPEQIIDFLKWSNWTACEYRQFFGGSIKPLIPTGMDGQYPICLDPAVRPITSKEKRCIVYSFGINNEWSFDEAMVEYGCDVFAFDPSMNETDHDHSEHIHFYNLGLSDGNYVDSNNWKLMTLDSIYRMLVPQHGETVIDYLKIDIGLDEWDALAQIIKEGTLSKVRQLTVEFHLPKESKGEFFDIKTDVTLKGYRSLVRLIKSIEDQMTRFDSRPNFWSTDKIKHLNNYTGPICFELSFHQVLQLV